MPLNVLPTLTTTLNNRSYAAERLGISTRSFDRHWSSLFTDAHDPGRK